MKVYITGCAGFVGSNVAKRFVDDGHEVFGVDNFSSGNFALIHDFRKRMADFSCEDFSSQVSYGHIKKQKFDVVIHLAAAARVSLSIDRPHWTHKNNVDKTMGLLETCRGNVGRFVFASSSSVYGGASVLPTPVTHPTDPKSPYALQKLIIEKYNKLYSEFYDLDTTSLRFFNVFGPNQLGGSAYNTAISAWLYAIKHGHKCRFDGTGEQSRDMTYVDNVVDCIVLAATHTGKLNGAVFNVGCQDRVSNKAIMDVMIDRFGSKVNIENAPFRKGDVMHTCADISYTRDALGYNPNVKFSDGLERTIDWALNSRIF